MFNIFIRHVSFGDFPHGFPRPSSSGVCSPKMRRTSARSTAAQSGSASAPMAMARRGMARLFRLKNGKIYGKPMENLWKTYMENWKHRGMMWPYQTVEEFLPLASFEFANELSHKRLKQKRSFTSWFVPRLEF